MDNYNWKGESTFAFNNLKHALTTTPVLQLPNFKKEFFVETDTFGFFMDAMQIQEGSPIAFFSKQFPPMIHDSMRPRNGGCH